MKNLKAGLFVLLSLSSLMVYGIPTTGNTAEVNNKIQTYLSSIDYSHDTNEATVFSNFLISEEGDLFTVDFMVTENDEIVVLSKDYEDEYYRVELFNSNYTSQYSLPVAYVNPE